MQRRPFPVTIIAVSMVLSAVFVLFESPKIAPLASWAPVFLAVLCITTVISGVGVWLMQKWAVYLCIALYFLAAYVGKFGLGVAYPLRNTLIPVIVVVTLLYYICLRRRET